MSEPPRRILILGGYGVFGGRLAQLLAGEPRVTLVIAGRSLEKAREFCARLPKGAERLAAAFDRDGDVAAQLSSLMPDLVVDASGPFQAYAGDVYKLVAASIAIGACYMDLADSSAFVADIGAFDAGGRTLVAYRPPGELAEGYAVRDRMELLERMTGMLEELVAKATAP